MTPPLEQHLQKLAAAIKPLVQTPAPDTQQNRDLSRPPSETSMGEYHGKERIENEVAHKPALSLAQKDMYAPLKVAPSDTILRIVGLLIALVGLTDAAREIYSHLITGLDWDIGLGTVALELAFDFIPFGVFMIGIGTFLRLPWACGYFYLFLCSLVAFDVGQIIYYHLHQLMPLSQIETTLVVLVYSVICIVCLMYFLQWTNAISAKNKASVRPAANID